MNVWKTKAFSEWCENPLCSLPTSALGSGLALWTCICLWLYSVSDQWMTQPGSLHGCPVHLCWSLTWVLFVWPRCIRSSRGFPTCRGTRRRNVCLRSYSEQALSHKLPPSNPPWGGLWRTLLGLLPLRTIVLWGCPPTHLLANIPTPKVKSNCLWDNGPSLLLLATQLALSSRSLGNNSVRITARFPVCACVWLESRGCGSWGAGRGVTTLQAHRLHLVQRPCFLFTFKVLKINVELYRSSLELVWKKLKYHRSG